MLDVCVDRPHWQVPYFIRERERDPYFNLTPSCYYFCFTIVGQSKGLKESLFIILINVKFSQDRMKEGGGEVGKGERKWGGGYERGGGHKGGAG